MLLLQKNTYTYVDLMITQTLFLNLIVVLTHIRNNYNKAF